MTKKRCKSCGELTEETYECPECEREGCEECMPVTTSFKCPECEEELEE